jgi:hypothetical protein
MFLPTYYQLTHQQQNHKKHNKKCIITATEPTVTSAIFTSNKKIVDLGKNVNLPPPINVYVKKVNQ